MKSSWMVIVTALLLVAIGCSSATLIPVRDPAEFNVPPNIKAVGVFSFECLDHRDQFSLSRSLADKLSEHILGEKHFTMVERQKLQAALHELQLGMSDLFNQSKAARFGQYVQADAIISGNFKVSVDEREWTTQHQVTDSKTGQTRTVIVPHWKRVLSIDATVKMVNIHTGELIGTKTTKRSAANETEGENYRAKMASWENLVAAAAALVAIDFTKAVTPHTVLERREFRDGSGPYNAYFEQAKKLISRQLWEEAGAQYQIVLNETVSPATEDAQKSRAAALVNMSFIDEVNGDVYQARTRIEEALTLRPTDEKLLDALNSIKRRITKWEKLKEQTQGAAADTN